MEETPLKSMPPTKRQRSTAPVSSVDIATRAGPVATLLNVPLSVIFQPQLVSIATPSKTKEKPLLSRAEAQAFLRVHYSAQDMDALVATAEAAFRQKLKYVEYEQSICRVDHPMTRSLLPLLRLDPHHCLKYVPAELNNGILSKLDQLAVSLQHFGEMNSTTADSLADIHGMELLADGKNKLSELQMEVSRRIAALLAHEITEETNWCSMEEYCQRLFPNSFWKRVQVQDPMIDTPLKRNVESVKQPGKTLQEQENENDIHHALAAASIAKSSRSSVLDKNVTFQEEMTTVAASLLNPAMEQVPVLGVEAIKTPETAHDPVRASEISLLHQAVDIQIPTDGIMTTAPQAECMQQHLSSPAREKQLDDAILGDEAAAAENQTPEPAHNRASGIALLHQAVYDRSPMDTNLGNQPAANKKQDDLFGIDKENSQSQQSQNISEAAHPTLLIYGSQVSQASSSNHSLTCRPPGAETQTAAALLSHFARSSDSQDVMQE